MTLINVLKQGVRDISQARAGGAETTKAGLVDREQIVLLQEFTILCIARSRILLKTGRTEIGL